MHSLIEAGKSILMNNLHVTAEEQILIVTDSDLKELASVFYQAGQELGNETMFMEMATRSRSGEEPPQAVAEAMKSAEVILCITKHSLSHTRARKEASAAGARIATMPGATLDMLQEGAITADYQEIEELNQHFCNLLDSGNQVTIKKGQTELTFLITGRKSISSTGVFRQKGASGNLPSGESYIAPLEDSANGTILIDGAIAGIGVLKEPIILTIEHGRLIDASGQEGKRLLELLGEGPGRKIAEFGIGTNKKARLTGNVLEDEKIYGTVHIAFGSNKPFGGVTEAGVHIDCVILDPEVWIDQEQLSLK